MKLMIVNSLCLVLMLAGHCSSAAARAFVGIVKSVEGSAVIKRNDATITVVQGMAVEQVDIVKTHHQGYVGLVFADDTRVSIGPNTEIAVDEYLFNPLENKLSFVLRLIRGTLSFLSGQMTKLSPDSVQLVMPAATIGVRGTHVLIDVDRCAENPKWCYYRGGGER